MLQRRAKAFLSRLRHGAWILVASTIGSLVVGGLLFSCGLLRNATQRGAGGAEMEMSWLRSRKLAQESVFFHVLPEWKSSSGPHLVVSTHFDATSITEWVNYHLWIGFDAFIMYDESHSDDVSMSMRNHLDHYIQAGIVVLHKWRQEDKMGSYQHAWMTYGLLAASITYLEADEYMVLCEHALISDAYRSLGLIDKESPVACIEITSFLFGTSYQSWLPRDSSVTKTFSLRSGSHSMASVALRGGQNRSVPSGSWHQCILNVNTSQLRLVQQNSMRIHHYHFKDGEHFMEHRMITGRLLEGHGQKINYTLDMHQCEAYNCTSDLTLAPLTDLEPWIMSPRPVQITHRSTSSLTCLPVKNVTVKTCRNAEGKVIANAPMAALRQTPPFQLPPFDVLIHAVDGQGINLILMDMLVTLHQHGVYQGAENFTISVAGPGVGNIQQLLRSFGQRFAKAKAIEIHPQANESWEFGSVNLLRSQAVAAKREKHFLYLHTKGMFKKHMADVLWQWRKYLEHGLVVQQEAARTLLAWGFDAVGSNALNMDFESLRSKMRYNPDHAWHFSGNMWWATAAHLERIPSLPMDRKIDHIERCKAENFILSPLPDMCAAEIRRSTHSHIYRADHIPNASELQALLEPKMIIPS